MQSPRSCAHCGTLHKDDVLFETKVPRTSDFDFRCAHCHEIATFDFHHQDDGSYGQLLIINGPFCTNKWAIGDVFSKAHGFVHLNTTSLLNEAQKTNKLSTHDDIHADILWAAHQYLSLGQNVVISHCILPSFWVLYDHYFATRKIGYEMTILLPDLHQIYKKNDKLNQSFDDELLEEMHTLFQEEETWMDNRYDYVGGSDPIQIAETLHMCYFPQQQKMSIFESPFAVQEAVWTSHHHKHLEVHQQTH